MFVFPAPNLCQIKPCLFKMVNKLPKSFGSTSLFDARLLDNAEAAEQKVEYPIEILPSQHLRLHRNLSPVIDSLSLAP